MSFKKYHLHSGHVIRIYPEGEVWLDTSDRMGAAIRLGTDHDAAVSVLQAVLDRLEVEDVKLPSWLDRATWVIDWTSRALGWVVLVAGVLWVVSAVARLFAGGN